MTYRRIEIVRALWGASMLMAPRWILQNVHHGEVDGRAMAVARVLGARQLGQAALSGLNPTSNVLALGVWVDSVHSASMIALAGVDRARARAALTDALVAGTWAVIGFRDLRTSRAAQAGGGSARDGVADWMLGQLPVGPPLRRWAQDDPR